MGPFTPLDFLEESFSFLVESPPPPFSRVFFSESLDESEFELAERIIRNGHSGEKDMN